jgi:hypothetical protein
MPTSSFSIVKGMNIIRSILSLAALLGSALAVADGGGYRLAGSIVADDANRSLALVEKPDGTQVLLRPGDVLDDGVVLEVTKDQVRIDFGAEAVVLKLDGRNDSEAAMAMQYEPAQFSDSQPIPLDSSTLSEISELAETADADNSEEYASRVLKYLDLPAEARIVAVNNKGTSSLPAALREIASSIEKNKAVESGLQFVVSVAADGTNKRIYVFSDQAGQITDQTIKVN